LDNVETNPKIVDAPSIRVKSLWHTVRGYILWSYERGSLQYDIMVTLILLFIFLSPYWVNFNDKPIERNPHPTGVVVSPEAHGGFIYQVDASAISAKEDDGIRAQLLRVIEPISGGVSITKYEPVRDHAGRIVSYRVWVQKQ
jgi:hypothetical protein